MELELCGKFYSLRIYILFSFYNFNLRESVSGFIEHAVSPFKLFLAPSCHIFIVSANGYLVWASILKYNNSIGPCRLKLLDEGRLVVTDNSKVFN